MTSTCLATDVRVCRDTTLTSNHSITNRTSPHPKPSHRRRKRSIHTGIVSKPIPITGDEEIKSFNAMASRNHQARNPKPKAFEKKVKVVAPGLVKPDPEQKSKLPHPTASKSWYSPANVKSPKGALQPSISNPPPRSVPSKANMGGTNPTNVFRNPGSKSLAKAAEDTLHPTVLLVRKPLPKLPDSESLSSRWSASTGSVYSDSDDSFSALHLFPSPPFDTQAEVSPDHWENSHSLPTTPLYTSFLNTSSDSVGTILARTTPNPPTLKVVPRPKNVDYVHQHPHTSCSFSQVQDSIVIHRGRVCPKAPTEDDIIAPSIRNTCLASQGESSSFSSPDYEAEVAALVHPGISAEELEKIRRARAERDKQWDLEQQRLQEMKEFGYKIYFDGEKLYDPRAVPTGFEPAKPQKRGWNWF